MIYGIGTDIIDIRRIKKVIKKYNFRFKKKCFHENEIKRSENKFNSIEKGIKDHKYGYKSMYSYICV